MVQPKRVDCNIAEQQSGWMDICSRMDPIMVDPVNLP